MIIYDYTIRNCQVLKLRSRLLHRQRDLWVRIDYIHMYIYYNCILMESFWNIAIDTLIPLLFMTPWESVRPYQSDIWYVQLSQVGLYLGRVRHNIPSWLPGGDKNNANTTSASATASASTSVNMSTHMADTLEQLEWTVLVTVCGRQVDGRTDEGTVSRRLIRPSVASRANWVGYPRKII